MHKSPTYELITMRSLGIRLGFYDDPNGDIYMHHKECRPEHLAKRV